MSNIPINFPSDVISADPKARVIPLSTREINCDIWQIAEFNYCFIKCRPYKPPTAPMWWPKTIKIRNTPPWRVATKRRCFDFVLILLNFQHIFSHTCSLFPSFFCGILITHAFFIFAIQRKKERGEISERLCALWVCVCVFIVETKGGILHR